MQQPHPLWESRGHFFSVASRLMRQVLVDHARQFQSSKRGSGQVEFQLDNDRAFSTVEALDLLRLDEAITELERMDVRKARIVEQHFFGGLTAGEIAELHKLSTITVRRDLRIAAAWLKSWLLQ
jgi:RNA polymerase sigma factor (TIGR02999 family)